MMNAPIATYRVQLSKDFTLEQLKEQLSYLHQLGISTIYASPICQARSGSTHGYDVTNPEIINPEVGSEGTLKEIATWLQARNMTWLQDIVPNHMAYDTSNPWLADVLEQGPHATHADYFDINWSHSAEQYRGKVMTPFLGAPLEEVITQHQLQLSVADDRLSLNYYDNQYPVSPGTYSLILQRFVDQHPDSPLNSALRSHVTAVTAYADEPSSDWRPIATQIVQTVRQHHELQQFVDNYHTDTPALRALLEEQYYRLVYWKTTEQQINYRRFFTVNDLICLNIHHPTVFDHYHRQLKQWIDQDYIQGVRIDHIDGLLDPTTYLHRLRALVGDNTYVIAEKILEHDESLPPDWPIQGSSGYDLLADINQLFTDTRASKSLLSYYATWNPPAVDYEALVYRNKHFVLYQRMHGELDNLVALLDELNLVPDKVAEDEIRSAVGHLLAAFPVYRLYSTAYPFSDTDQNIVQRAFERARSEATLDRAALDSTTPDEALDALQQVFATDTSGDADVDERRLRFVVRFQQFAGPLAAKGVEDTTFYQYYAMIAHNEVGDSPERLGIDTETFHQRMQARPKLALSATATHDTKRGEDARRRISVLSEMPSAWMKETARWRYANEPYMSGTDEHAGWPDSNFSYFIYQTLLATYPFHTSPEEDDYASRLKAYLNKAAKEGKIHTSWSDPNEGYERAIEHFATQMLQDRDFMEDFADFAKPIARLAVTYSLAQTLLKLTVPGIPDTYQGTEYWDLSMVDPDNRRPVDYPQRRADLQRLDETPRDELITQLTGDLLNPAIKLFVTAQSLRVRQKLHQLFAQGSYETLDVQGDQAERIVAFQRVWQSQKVVVVVPVGVAALSLTDDMPLGEACWADTHILTEDESWTNVFTQQSMSGGHLAIREILATFPVALLTNHSL